MLPPYKAFCQCAACGEYFKSPRSFDRHRVGKKERSCLSAPEMEKKGMSKNAKGYWINAAFDADAKYAEK